VLEALKPAAEAGSPVPLVYASSAAVLGPAEDYKTFPVPDDHNHQPRTLYGVTKLANEGSARIFWQDYKVPSVGLRPLTAYGVGREVGLTSGPTKAVKAAILGRSYECPCSGVTGFVYVKDVARIFIESAVALSRKPGAHVCNIRGLVTSVEDFMGVVQKVFPKASLSIEKGAPSIPICADVTEARLENLLDAKAGSLHTPLEQALREVVTDFKNLQDEGRLHANDLPPLPKL